MTLPPFHLWSLLRLWHQLREKMEWKVAREERKNGLVLAPNTFFNFMHSGTSESEMEVILIIDL